MPLHEEVAEGTEHLVKIRDMLPDVEVVFGDQTLSCCVAALDFIEGPMLTGVFRRGAEGHRPGRRADRD